MYCRAGQARCQVALGDLAEGVVALEHTRRLAARLPGLALGWQLLHHQGAEDALAMALDEGWPERIGEFEPWMAPGPDRHWGSAGIAGIGARTQARMGHTDAALSLLARPVRALRPGAGMGAELHADGVRGGRDALAARPPRPPRRRRVARCGTRRLPADFRFPMTDARLALARLCALVGAHRRGGGWFADARDVLDAQRARPLRAVVDHDEALMHLRAGDPAAATPYIAAAQAAFDRLGMTGWIRRLDAVTASCSGPHRVPPAAAR